MDQAVPADTARLFDFVRKIEVGTEDRTGYDVIYANRGRARFRSRLLR